MSTEIKRLVKQLGIKEDKAIKLPSGGGALVHDFDVNPEDFLQRAEDDYELGGSGALLNAISNAKRAIHCQIDKALICLGFIPSGWGIKRKVGLLDDLGFVAPRILKRVTDARNILEHEYRSPTLEQVEEALDLAALFVEATNRHLDRFDHEFGVGNSDAQVDAFHCVNELSFSFDESQKCFRVWGYSNMRPEREWISGGGGGTLIGKVEVLPEEELFNDIVRLVVAGDRPIKVKEALSRFFASLKRL